MKILQIVTANPGLVVKYKGTDDKTFDPIEVFALVEIDGERSVHGMVCDDTGALWLADDDDAFAGVERR